MNNWCILRTAPSRTLLLAAALTAAGIRAWTPQQSRTVRLPRSRASKAVSSPLTPTIVFADYDLVPLLRAISRMPTPSHTAWCEAEKRHVSHTLPNFTVFKYLDSFPRIADSALDALRVAEQTVMPRAARHVFHRNDPVKIHGAGFDGMVGKVDRTRGRFAYVEFPGAKHLAMLDSRLLLPVDRAA